MPIVDLAADWKAVNADRITDVRVRQVDPDDGPADDDSRTDDIAALQTNVKLAPVSISGGEVSATTCRFEFALADVRFTIWQRCQIEDAQARVWTMDDVDLDASGALYRCECTLTRG